MFIIKKDAEICSANTYCAKFIFYLGADHLTSEVGVGWLIWYRFKFFSNPFMHRKFCSSACVYTFFLHVPGIFFSGLAMCVKFSSL